MPPQPRSKLRSWCLLASTALAMTSCQKGESLNQVEGKVLQNGQPLNGALVTFHPKGNDGVSAVRPTGTTKEDGTFHLESGPVPGAAAGDYTVTIVRPETKKIAKKDKKDFSTGDEDETVDTLGGVYADRTKSKIAATVKAGANKLEPFDLKP